MKKNILAVTLLTLLLTSPAFAVEESHLKAAYSLLEVSDVKENINSVFEKMLEVQKQQSARFADDPEIAAKYKQVIDIMSKELKWDNLKDKYANLYAEMFSEKELKDLQKFYSSEVGKKFVTQQPKLLEESQKIGQGLMVEIMPQIQKVSKEIMQKTMEKAQKEKEAAAAAMAKEGEGMAGEKMSDGDKEKMMDLKSAIEKSKEMKK